jgi:hypothetical protein
MKVKRMGITEITGFWSIIIAKKNENKSCQSNLTNDCQILVLS